MPSPRRSAIAALPDLATTAEGGLPELNVSVWHGLYVPKGTPAEVVQKLNEALKVALKDQTVDRRASPSSGRRPCPRTSPRRRRSASACSRRSSCGSRSSRRPACSRNRSRAAGRPRPSRFVSAAAGERPCKDRSRTSSPARCSSSSGWPSRLRRSRYQLGTAFRMGPGYFPLVLGGCLVLLGVLVVVEGLRGRGEGRDRRVPWRAIVLILGAIIFFGVTVRGLGLVASLFMTAFWRRLRQPAGPAWSQRCSSPSA